MPKLLTYQDLSGKQHFHQWWEGIKGSRIENNVRKRIEKLREGHFGDAHAVRFRNSRSEPQITEVRINVRPGFRVYCAEVADGLLLLNAGSKNSQQNDIRTATRLLRESEERPDGQQAFDF